MPVADAANRALWALALLLLNGYFATAGVALASVRRSRLKELAASGQAGARAALNLLANRERTLTLIQLGASAATLALGWVGQDLLFRLLEPRTSTAMHAAAFAGALLLVTSFHVVAGEIVPKNLAIGKAERLAILLAPPLLVLNRLTAPLLFLIEGAAFGLVRRWSRRREPLGGGQAVETLKLLISLNRRQGQLESFEEQAIQRLLDLQDYVAREVMVPRPQIVSVAVETPLEEALEAMARRRLARLPVYEGDPEQIVGVLHYPDVVAAGRPAMRRAAPLDLRRLMRQPLLVPETKPLNQLLESLRRERSHLAIVVDEHGTVVGLVTLSDVLAHIFGEVQDQRPPQPTPMLLELDGGTTIRDLEVDYGIELPAGAGFETLAGFLLYRLGYIPQPGDRVDYGNFRFTVVEMNRKRIARVRIERTAED